MRVIFTKCESLEEADKLGHFIMSKGYKGVQNDSYRYCKESMSYKLSNNIRHNRNYVFVGADTCQLVVSASKKYMKRRGLKYIEKMHVFKELLDDEEHLQEINRKLRESMNDTFGGRVSRK